MAYASVNYKTKKALKEALERGDEVYVTQPGPFAGRKADPVEYLEGPWSPEPHRWYAAVYTNPDGRITGIKK